MEMLADIWLVTFLASNAITMIGLKVVRNGI